MHPLPTNEQIANFYTRQSQRFGPSEVLPHHRARAERLRRIAGPAPLRVLELGSGAGGTAVATAGLGYEVTSVELSPLRVEYARQLASYSTRRIDIREGDFYTANLGEGFGVVAYWNGFGMGNDRDQRRLLRRVSQEWLAPNGVMLMDVFNPIWWARSPREVRVHKDYEACQQTTFDDATCRFVDRWWPIGREAEAIEQTIRCYSPVDLTLLVEGTGMEIERFEVDDHSGLEGLEAVYSYLAVLHPLNA